MVNVYSNIFPASSGGVWKSRDVPVPAIGLPSTDSSVSLCGTFMVRRVLTLDGAFVAGAWFNTSPATPAPCSPTTIDNATIKRRMKTSPGWIEKSTGHGRRYGGELQHRGGVAQGGTPGGEGGGRRPECPPPKIN